MTRGGREALLAPMRRREFLGLGAVAAGTALGTLDGIVRTALGTATAPPNSLIVSLAVFLTAFKMGRCNALTTLASGL